MELPSLCLLVVITEHKPATWSCCAEFRLRLREVLQRLSEPGKRIRLFSVW